MRYKLTVALLLLLLAIVLQFQIGRITGLWINFVFSIAVAAAFSLDFFELLFLLALAIFLLNWQSILGIEIILIMVLSVAVFFLKKFMPWHGWLNNLASLFVCIFILYFIVSPSYFFGNLGFFFEDVAISLIFSAIVFWAINKG